jgi:signal peptide peptidase SppA
MKILDILNAPWMITSGYHGDMTKLYLSHMRGEKIDFKAIEKAFIDGSDQRKEKLERLNIVNEIALIDISGPLTPGSSFFSFFFGGTAMDDIRTQMRLADESPDVREKLFVVNSPGGTVEGAFELADDVKASNEIKPINTFSAGTIASAAYLIVAPTNTITITGKSNQIGSIGVITSKSDFTEYDEKLGIKFDEYVSGEYKNIYSPDRKTDKFVSDAIQETVDYLATLFIDYVSEQREQLSAEFLTGLQARVLIGQQAIDGGLVDGVSTLEALTNKKQSGATNFNSGKNMDKLELKEKHPDLYAEIYGEGEKNGKTVSADSKAEIRGEERKRIAGIQGASFPGQEKLVAECIEKGTTIGDSAVLFNKAQKESLDNALNEHKSEASKPVTLLENQTEEEEEIEEKIGFEAQVKAYAEKNNCKRTQAIKAVIQSDPEAHKAYVEGKK